MTGQQLDVGIVFECVSHVLLNASVKVVVKIPITTLGNALTVKCSMKVICSDG